ncbi:hypothetical protein [Parasedimentitalea maritima]|uniref:Uncharacterized protein n=1 Tax=Parasedimentitalea maritima TaxID=2578117 RepID=A0A6A4RNZ8_9RHOB|nr:hypothetical protein [Zongyanglinia marina]KAE9632700.1 hypothetical protein GP644_02700 [Zongyanglinia marina]
MPILLLLLLAGVLGYFVWRHKTSTLTRNCRWRQDKRMGEWRCTFCGARDPGEDSPRECLRDQQNS